MTPERSAAEAARAIANLLEERGYAYAIGGALASSLTFIMLVACGGAPGQRVEEARTIQLDELSLSSCPEREQGIPPVETRPVSAPVRPEAVGVWVRWCDTAAPGPHAPRGHDVFVYDGAFVTLVSNVNPIAEAVPPIRMYAGLGIYRLESRWDGDLLQVRFPPWLLSDADGERWLDIAVLSGGHFVWADTAALAYERGQPRYHSDAFRRLSDPRDPLDYERTTAERARGELAFRSFDDAIHECAVASVARLERPSRGTSIRLSVRIDPEGRVVGAPTLDTEDAAFATCVTDALVGHHVEGFSAPQEAGYGYRFLLSSE